MSFLRWINRHPRVCAILCALGAGLYVFVHLVLFPYSSLLSWNTSIFLIVLIAAVLRLEFYAMSRETTFCLQALELCNPEPLLDFSRGLLASRNPKARSNRSVRFNAAFNAMTALLSLGRYEEAAEVAAELQSLLTKMPPIWQGYLHLNSSVLFLEQRRFEEALAALRDAQTVLSQYGEKTAAVWTTSLEFCSLQYRILTEEMSEALLAEALGLLARRAAASLRARVCAQYHVACCLLALDRQAEALPYLRFVAYNGGQLWYRRWASGKLDTCSAKQDERR